MEEEALRLDEGEEPAGAWNILPADAFHGVRPARRATSPIVAMLMSLRGDWRQVCGAAYEVLSWQALYDIKDAVAERGEGMSPGATSCHAMPVICPCASVQHAPIDGKGYRACRVE